MSGKMTPRARAVFEIYRDMGAGRSLAKCVEAMGRPPGYLSTLRSWSARYEWQRLVTEHDHAALREGLGQREIIKERTTQRFIDRSHRAEQVVWDIMTDDSKVPVLDRHGDPSLDGDGRPMFKPVVKPSTKLEAAKFYLGIAGHVPVKRTETIDRSQESLDAAANIISTLTPAQVAAFIVVLDSEDKGETDG